VKKLYRSKTDKKLTGLLGGVGEYLKVDPTALRLLFLVLVIFSGFFPGVFFYLLALLVVPEPPAKSSKK
jgi:phage shock protein PspC (stress-responsive transcriptional regulator)